MSIVLMVLIPVFITILFIFSLIKFPFKTLVIILLSFIALYITNPTEEKFNSYYSSQISKEEMGKNWFEQTALEGLKVQGKLTLKRKDLIVFSIYQIDRLDKKIGYIGILNFFIPIYEEEDSVI